MRNFCSFGLNGEENISIVNRVVTGFVANTRTRGQSDQAVEILLLREKLMRASIKWTRNSAIMQNCDRINCSTTSG